MSSGAVTQLDVRATMAHLGGYWSPSAGVLRLLEELGEVAELVSTDAPAPDALAEELADVWIISTAVADQYLASVAPLGAGSGAATVSAEAAAFAPAPAQAMVPFEDIVAAAGQIARVVNYYDGPKAPRTLEDWTGIQPAIDAFHRALHAFASARGVELGREVGMKLERSRTIDASRFARTFDPSTAPVLDRLREFRPELTDARLLGAPAWPEGPFEVGCARVSATLRRFLRARRTERLDGLVVFPPQALSSTELSTWTVRLHASVIKPSPPNTEPTDPVRVLLARMGALTVAVLGASSDVERVLLSSKQGE